MKSKKSPHGVCCSSCFHELNMKPRPERCPICNYKFGKVIVYAAGYTSTGESLSAAKRKKKGFIPFDPSL